MELAWTIVSVIVPVLIGLGVTLAVIEASRGEFWVVRICFVLSGVLLGATTIAWLLTTDMSLTLRVIVGFVVGALIFVALPESIRWVNAREKKLAPKAETVVPAQPVAEPDQNKKFVEKIANTEITYPSSSSDKIDLNTASLALKSIAVHSEAQKLYDITRVEESAPAIYQKSSLEFGYAITSLQSSFDDLAKQSGTSVTTNFTNLDSILKEQSKKLKFIALKENTKWSLYVIVGLTGDNPMLYIRSPESGTGVVFTVMPEAKIITSILTFPGKIVKYGKAPLEDYKELIKEYLGLFLAAKVEADPLAPVPASPHGPDKSVPSPAKP